MKRLVAIGFVWLGCSVAWMILGSTVMARSGESSSELQQEVYLLWGPPMEQLPPHAVFHEPVRTRETVTTHDAQGRPFEQEIERTVDHDVEVALDASDIATRLSMQQRQKGLLWFPTYTVDFRARYTFRNDTAAPRLVYFRFPLVAENAIYDGFSVEEVDGGGAVVDTPATSAAPISKVTVAQGGASWTLSMATGERKSFVVRYHSRGTSTWSYRMAGAQAGEVRDFHLALDCDFADVDFPAGTLSPTKHQASLTGWHGDWQFSSLVANQPVGVSLPQKLNPGPLASKITFFAPIGMLFFFFVVAVFAAAVRRPFHPMHYFLIGCAFFAFHLLFAYLVDHLAILPAFALSSTVSLVLVVSYARLFVGWPFALGPMAGAQLVYLVLFSYTFFWKGFTGLAIAIGAVLTLLLVMQLTGRTDWERVNRERPIPPSPPISP